MSVQTDEELGLKLSGCRGSLLGEGANPKEYRKSQRNDRGVFFLQQATGTTKILRSVPMKWGFQILSYLFIQLEIFSTDFKKQGKTRQKQKQNGLV